MTNIKQLTAISELSIVKRYFQALTSFVESYAALEDKLKAHLDSRDYESCSAVIADICDMMVKIYADNIAADFAGRAHALKEMGHEKAATFVTDFMARASMLSIDIQMAANKGDDKGETPRKKISMAVEKDSILAVDDVSFFLNTLETLLSSYPYKLTCVTSGYAALSYLEKHCPALFLLDIEMPEMNGFELAKKIREAGHDSPIIFLTGHSSRKNVLKAIEAGATDFLMKPVNQEQVAAKIEKYLRPKST